MSPVALQLLRRLTVLLLLAAVVLPLGNRALRGLGLIGPSAAEEIEASARALEAARAYGASQDEPAYASAAKQLERARTLLQANRQREARHAAVEAREAAVEAQRRALAHRDVVARRAADVVAEVEAALEDLEDLYERSVAGLDEATTASLLSRMKLARAAGGGLFLAHENDEPGKVLAQEQAVKATLDAVRAELLAAR